METLIKRQAELYENLKQLQSNFKKDSDSRKTPEYLEERLNRLEQLWLEFEHNNLGLAEFKIPGSKHEYFTENIFESAFKIYQTTRNMILAFEKKQFRPTPNPSTPGTSASVHRSEQIEQHKIDKGTDPSGYLDELLSQQRTHFRALRRLISSINIEELTEKWELEDELRVLQSRWNTIDSFHIKIDNILQGGDLSYEDEFITYEASYKRIKRAINQKISSVVHTHTSTPQMDIPTFSGNYTNWPTFFDLFTAAIHDSNVLTKAQKMQLLKSKVRGEAERLIQHLQITAENYDTAWDILTHRYNNPQAIFTKHVETFLNQPNIHHQTSFELKRLHDTSMETLHAIHNLGIDTTTWDPLIVHILSKKLDSATYNDYKESRKQPRELPHLEEFMSFLENKFIALEPIRQRENSTQPTRPKFNQIRPSFNQNKPTFQQNRTFNYQSKYQPNYQPNYEAKYQKTYQALSTHTNKCPLCNQYHELFRCNKFANMSSEVRLKTVSRLKLCLNCLYNHFGNPCISQKRCKNCNAEHNTLLHNACVRSMTSEQPGTSTQAIGSVSQSPSPSTLNNKSVILRNESAHKVNYVASNDEEVLLTTIKINIESSDGNFIPLRALLDQGSQISLISENAAQQLGLQRNRYSASISGIGTGPKQSKGVVNLKCQSIYGDYQFETQALVISKVINNLPNSSFIKQNWPHLQNINLADPEFNVSKPIDLLLDANVYSEIIMSGLIKGPQEAPIAQQTKMGWILSGSVKRTFNCHVIINNLTDIAKYWEMEDIAPSSPGLSKEDEWCEKIYQSTTRRLSSGNYEVALPMKENFEKDLGESRNKSLAQFRRLEQKFSKDSYLAQKYREFMSDYEQLGHMHKVDFIKFLTCHIPHHEVWKMDSLTTQLRVVFNGASKTTSGKSLNDLMLRGPNLQQDLYKLILSWRQYQFVMNADIEKMFRMIFIRECDQHLQTIIWRNTQSEPMAEYHLSTVTYGTKAAPYLAMRTLRQLAIDDGHKFPLAVDVLNNNFYTDDLFYGSNSLQEAKEVQRQLVAILKGAGFNLRKWTSNHPQLLDGLSQEQTNPGTINFKDAETTKTLGLRWNPASDLFTYKNVSFKEVDTAKYTKRCLLSDISKVHDPIGWISPVTVKAKLLFQKAWAAGLSWDEELPVDILNEWLQLKTDLKSIIEISIPRHLGTTDQGFELHGFCDASEKAYASAIYIVTISDKGERTPRLVTAKTKLSPLNKTISLPRLELCAAVLLANLIKKVLDCFTQKDIKLFAWSDSMVVLGWIQGDVARWKQFVANRVQQITNVLEPSCWHHVRSEENASDCATRGISCQQLLHHSLWWEGPKWLTEINPLEITDVKYQSPDLEMKNISVNTALYHNNTSIVKDLLEKHNSISRVTKTIAWISRFLSRARGQRNAASAGALTPMELHNVLIKIITEIQSYDFKDEISSLKSKGKVHLNSKIASLNPYLDENGLLRVGGRLSNSNIQASAKNPIILSSEGRLTELIINQAHITTLHGGPRLTLSYIRNKYWVISGMRTVKKQLRRCVTCRRFSHQSLNQIMADLPKPRVTPSRAFTFCGVDFSGHVELKANKGRGIKTTKGYIAVFVCLTTKAIHLELVSDLSTPAFLAAFKRMCARRGTPKEMYSDNGTNFIGASRLLQKEYKQTIELISPEFLNSISELGIKWNFNAPAWPSAGGLWESAVRSMKYHLRRVIGTQKLTYEEFTTLLAQIEACLNSRPLCPLMENPDDIDVLTPGHFLVGGPLLSNPESESTNISLPRRWQLVQTMTRGFWRQWSHEYLQTLQTRCKWRSSQKNIEINDVVVIKDENLPPTRWGMARVIGVHPGKDGHVRVVTLKTKGGIIKRPITKLCLLPVNDEVSTSESSKTADPKQETTINQPINREESSRRTRTRNLNKFSAVTLFLSLLSLCMPSIQQEASLSSIANVTSLQNGNQSLYFDKITDLQHIKEDWKLIVYYNMSTYWQGLSKLDQYITHLRQKANELGDPQYNNIIYQLDHELRELEHHNFLLINRTPIKRQKRGLINGIGYVANSLFGILDDRFAEQYEKDIIKITQNENHLKNLIRNQTTIVEAEYNVLKRNENNMNKQFAFIKERLNNITKEVNEVNLSNQHGLYITSSAFTANMIISNLRRIQESLLDTVTDISHGRLNTHLITPEQLNEQINLISRHLQNDLSLPINRNEIREIYKLIKASARVFNNYLIIEIKIPLVSSDVYELNRIISIPRPKTARLLYQITSKFPYIAYVMRKDVIILLTENDVKSCIPISERMLCSFDKPVYDLSFKQSFCQIKLINNEMTNETPCISSLTDCRDQWIKLHQWNSWLFFCCNECAVRIFCPNIGMTMKTLKGIGIINIGQGCTLKGNAFSLYAHNNYLNYININNEIHIPEISVLNKLLNTTPQSDYPSSASNDHAYKEIEQRIESLKERQSDQFTVHDVHHYVISYVIVAIILVVGSIFAYSKIRSSLVCRRAREGHSQQQQVGEVPLPNIGASVSGSEVSEIVRSRSVLSVNNQGTSPIVSRPVRFIVPDESVELN